MPAEEERKGKKKEKDEKIESFVLNNQNCLLICTFSLKMLGRSSDTLVQDVCINQSLR